jgi:hypothetical protein
MFGIGTTEIIILAIIVLVAVAIIGGVNKRRQ